MFKNLFEKLKDISINRMLVVFVLIFFMFSGMLVRLFSMQVVNNENNEKEIEEEKTAEGYKIVSVSINPARGNIYDRNGNLLAYNTLQYNIEFFNSADLSTNDEKNQAISSLIRLLDENGIEREFDFPMMINADGKPEYTVSDSVLLRFLKNCYGLASTKDLTDEQKETTAEGLFEYLKKGNKITSMFGISDSYTDEEAMEICAYRYQLYINNPSYSSIRLASDISEEMRIRILENQNIIPCVYISKSYKRIYDDAMYFAHIIGYVGKINETELAAYNDDGNENYNTESVVGKLGVEKSYDEFLQGICGEMQLAVNSMGQVVSREVVVEPVDGNSLYLTIDRDSQVAGYYIVEKNIASTLLEVLVNSYDYGTKGESADGITIPIYEAYSSLITNNVIDVINFPDRELSDAEARIFQAYQTGSVSVIEGLKTELLYGNKNPYNNLGMYTRDYMDYLYDALKGSWGLLTVNIDTESSYFKAYLNGESSMAQLIEACIDNGNVDTSVLELDEGYYSTEEIYSAVYDFIFSKISEDEEFIKLVYRTMIFNGNVSARDVCLILYDQGILKADSDTYNSLLNYTLSPYDFMKRKINSLEITPAMLALKPCSGSIVATDPDSGDVIAMVSYPSYDNNRLTNQIDYDYYMKLSKDKSYPMLCRATQSKTTTGSTFKPLMSVLALTEGEITTDTVIYDRVKFEQIVPSPSCWASYGHGSLDVAGAIENSCNYFFFTIAYNMSLNSIGEYSDEQGLNIIQKYAAKFGFDSLSGVEISESTPAVSSTDAVRTSIGYFHSFAPVHISKYATTLANGGTCYDLTLIDKVLSKDGSTVFEKNANVYNELDEVSQSSWDAVHNGMYRVVNNGLKQLFKDISVKVAGKTGTAQVSLNQPNNAVFISYAPFDNPEISVTVVIPNGYKSGNAAKVAAEFYAFYFDGTNKDNLLSGNVFAGAANDTQVGD